MQYLPNNTHRIRSFVRRDSRMTSAQLEAYDTQWPRFGLSLLGGMLQHTDTFGRTAPCYLEIGFGNGQSLLQLAKTHPEADFIGIETHKPGIGALLLAMSLQQVTNIRIYHADAIDVLQHCIKDASLQGAQLFFPDPWPKRKHHERRLVQSSLIEILFAKIKTNGSLHLATDWQDYAKEMVQVMQQSAFVNGFPDHDFAPKRSMFRPVVTKFEQRAIHEGRCIYELQFIRQEKHC